MFCTGLPWLGFPQVVFHCYKPLSGGVLGANLRRALLCLEGCQATCNRSAPQYNHRRILRAIAGHIYQHWRVMFVNGSLGTGEPQAEPVTWCSSPLQRSAARNPGTNKNTIEVPGCSAKGQIQGRLVGDTETIDLPHKLRPSNSCQVQVPGQ